MKGMCYELSPRPPYTLIGYSFYLMHPPPNHSTLRRKGQDVQSLKIASGVSHAESHEDCVDPCTVINGHPWGWECSGMNSE